MNSWCSTLHAFLERQFCRCFHGSDGGPPSMRSKPLQNAIRRRLQASRNCSRVPVLRSIKALIHVFFGEREVAKIPDVPKDTPHDPDP